MCGSWLPHTATWRPWSMRESSARTSGTALPCFPSFFRRCASNADIPELARHFAEAALRLRLPRALPTPEDIELLTLYSWPGNIRELAAVIDRAAILGDGKRLEVAKALGVTANLPSAATNGKAFGRQNPAARSDCDARRGHEAAHRSSVDAGSWPHRGAARRRLAAD